MTSASVQVERRVGQRFSFLLPVSFRSPATGVEGSLLPRTSVLAALFFSPALPLHEGDEIELTLTMPSEITLGESMRVRCRGRILRMFKPADRNCQVPGEVLLQALRTPLIPVAETKIAVAVRLEWL